MPSPSWKTLAFALSAGTLLFGPGCGHAPTSSTAQPLAPASAGPTHEHETTTTASHAAAAADVGAAPSEHCSNLSLIDSPLPDEPSTRSLEDDGASEEEEQPSVQTSTTPTIRYTADVSDEDLAARWKDSIESLGSISVGFAHDGRLINGQQFPAGDRRAWVVISPGNAFGTTETVRYVVTAAEHVKAAHPDAFPLRVNGLSAREGGHLRPHRSHQNGRDVDLGFYYPSDPPPRVGARERVMAVDQNWSLIRALVTLTDVQVILVDRRVQEVLYDYALSIGEDQAWLDTLFRGGRDSIIQHAPRHRDHFHVRFYNPRAQELGRRVAPLLAQRPEHNLVSVRIRYGDTLSGIAVRYGSSVRAIQKANRMKGSFLRASQVLKVPLFGPCTRCPVPPPVEVPPRRLPPEPTRERISFLGPALRR